MGVQQALARRGARLAYLPPYAPDLSAIEPRWSKAKTALRAAKARTCQAWDCAITYAITIVTHADAQNRFMHFGYALR